MTLRPFPHCPADCPGPLAGVVVGVTLSAGPDSLPQACSVPGARHCDQQSLVLWVTGLGCPESCCLELQNASRSSNSLWWRGEGFVKHLI